MRTFVKTFALPVLGAGLIYILTNQLPIQEQYRVSVVIALTLVAVFVAWLIEEKRDEKEHERTRSRIFALLAVVVSAGAILLLSHYRNRLAESTTLSNEIPGKDSGQTSRGRRVPNLPVPPVRTTQNATDPKTRPKDGLLDSIDAAPRSRNSGPDWVVNMYSEEGGDFPILRATSQQALSVNGISITSLIRNSAPIRTSSEVFTATAATIETLKPYCDGLIIGKLNVHTVPSDQFSGMYATHLSADVKLISTSRGVRREFVIEEDGGGFEESTSRSNAERRLAEKLKTELAHFSFQ